MKITETIFSIPPHLSTSWDNIFAIYTEDSLLKITLKTGTVISIPSLTEKEIKKIFQAHSGYMEKLSTNAKAEEKETESSLSSIEQLLYTFPVKIGTEGLAGLGKALKHDPTQKNFPTLPPDVLSKISGLLKIIPEDDLEAMPPAEKGCGCIYCQIRQILTRPEDQKSTHPELHVADEEKVHEEELKFEEWQVTLQKDNLYIVTNKLHHSESYTVHLGDPIGCTCGKDNCEHIVAVLKS